MELRKPYPNNIGLFGKYRSRSTVGLALLVWALLVPSVLSANGESLSLIHKKEKNFDLQLQARRFAQGEVIRIQIDPTNPGLFEEKFRVFADGREVNLAPWDRARVGFIPIGPERKPGAMVVEVQSKKAFRKTGLKKYEIDIHKTDFLVIQKQSITLDKKYTQVYYPPETLKFIQDCTHAKNQAFASVTPLQFQSGFRDPVSVVHYTSPFYVRRDYNKQKGKPHGGLDYRGKSGTPIFAIQDGTVVLADKMYFEGNFTILDHGNRIFSFYMHQSEILVKPGDKVSKGQVIGKIGSTGMSTGPHLHLGVKIDGVLVNPLALLAFRDI